MKFIHLLLFALFASKDATPVRAVDTNRPSFRSLGAEEIGGGGAGAKISKKEDKETIEVSFPTSTCSASTLDSYDKDFTMMLSRSQRRKRMMQQNHPSLLSLPSRSFHRHLLKLSPQLCYCK
jgi:hypothetical protein